MRFRKFLYRICDRMGDWFNDRAYNMERRQRQIDPEFGNFDEVDDDDTEMPAPTPLASDQLRDDLYLFLDMERKKFVGELKKVLKSYGLTPGDVRVPFEFTSAINQNYVRPTVGTTFTFTGNAMQNATPGGMITGYTTTGLVGEMPF